MHSTFWSPPPKKIITPYNANQIQTLSSLVDEWALLRCSYDGELDNHYPKDKLLKIAFMYAFVFSINSCIHTSHLLYFEKSPTGRGGARL